MWRHLTVPRWRHVPVCWTLIRTKCKTSRQKKIYHNHFVARSFWLIMHHPIIERYAACATGRPRWMNHKSIPYDTVRRCRCQSVCSLYWHNCVIVFKRSSPAHFTVPVNCSIPVCLLLFECPHLRSIAAGSRRATGTRTAVLAGTKCVANTLRHSRIVCNEQQVASLPYHMWGTRNGPHDSRHDAHNPTAGWQLLS